MHHLKTDKINAITCVLMNKSHVKQEVKEKVQKISMILF